MFEFLKCRAHVDMRADSLSTAKGRGLSLTIAEQADD
jgi:hypothetical protein